MRQDEEYAKDAFDRFLEHAGAAPAVWQDGTDPPDYFLSVRGMPYAVEVTQVMEQIDLGTASLPYEGMAQGLKRLTERLEAQALAAGVLDGTYVLGLSPIPNLATHEPTIAERTVRYLAQPEKAARGIWIPLLEGPSGPLVEIMKVADTGAALGEMIGGSGPKWGGQVVEEGSRLIHAALVTKANRLRRIPGSHIILLIDAYHYAAGEVWQASLALAGQLRSRFHTVARIGEDYECQILYSGEPSWQAAA